MYIFHAVIVMELKRLLSYVFTTRGKNKKIMLTERKLNSNRIYAIIRFVQYLPIITKNVGVFGAACNKRTI